MAKLYFISIKQLLRCEEYFRVLYLYTFYFAQGVQHDFTSCRSNLFVSDPSTATRATIPSSAYIIADLTHGGLL